MNIEKSIKLIVKILDSVELRRGITSNKLDEIDQIYKELKELIKDE